MTMRHQFTHSLSLLSLVPLLLLAAVFLTFGWCAHGVIRRRRWRVKERQTRGKCAEPEERTGLAEREDSTLGARDEGSREKPVHYNGAGVDLCLCRVVRIVTPVSCEASLLGCAIAVSLPVLPSRFSGAAVFLLPFRPSLSLWRDNSAVCDV
jgi:hypothetical protein